MPPKKVASTVKKGAEKVVEKPTGKKKPAVVESPTANSGGKKKVDGTARSSSAQTGAAGSQTSEAGSQTCALLEEGEGSQSCVTAITAVPEQAPVEEGKFVFLEVCDYEKPFPKHALELGKALHAAGFIRSKELTKVGRFRYKVELHEAKDRLDLSRINLSSLNLKLFTPTAKKQMICFIRGVPLDFSEDEIQEIQCEAQVVKVERIKRRGEGEELVDTPNLKVTVQGTAVPRMVRIFGVSFRAEQYIFPVKQCRTCWRFGHSSKVCFGNPRCQVCGRVHVTAGECKEKVCCRNCRGNHEASDKNCPERKRRADIFRTMAKKNVPYAEAEKDHPKESNRFGLLEEDDGTGEGTSGSGFSYAKVARQRRADRRNSAETAGFAEYTHVEVVGVEVLSYGDPVKLVSIYVPPGRLPVQQVRTELTDLFGELNQLTGKVVIGGDFNAHHPEWSPLSKSCPRGAHLSELIADSKFCLMNKGESTTIALPDERDSAIDLTFGICGP
ncbi:hypothetical protein quinque_014997 [Culex quinquefasciatus]